MNARHEPARGDTTVEHLRAGLAGDAVRMEVAYERLTDPLLLVARKCMHGLRDHSYCPEDMVQEAWVRTLHRDPPVTAQPDLGTRQLLAFMAQIVRRIAKDVMKGMANRRRITVGGTPPESGPEGAVAATGVVTRLHRAERRSELLRIVESLDAIHRDAWTLRNVELTSDEDAATIQGVSRAAFRQRVHRANEILRGRLPGSILDELT